MDPLVNGARADGGPENDVNLLIEKGFLLLGSIEFQIDEHLMAHGTRIDPETRFFMAQVRDAAGDAAAKLLDEARSRIEAVPAEQGDEQGAEQRADRAGGEAAEEVAPALPVPFAGPRSGRRARDGRRRRASVMRAIASTTLGTATAALLLTILIGGQPGSTLESAAAGTEPVLAADERPIAAPRPGTHPAEREPAKASRPSTSVSKLAQARRVRPGGRATVAARAPATHPAEREPPPNAGAWTVTAAIADPSTIPPYPDPLAGMEQLVLTEAAAAAEETLALSRADRREVQRRLALAAFDPQLFDGIFGPATRDALAAWQAAAGLTATGFLNEPTLALLRERTAADYRAWTAAEAARARREAQTAILSSPVPPASPSRPDRCSRLPSGKIVYGRGVRCDFRGLRESLAQILG